MLFGLLKDRPDQRIIDAVGSANVLMRHTPDIQELQTHHAHNVFVYNSLQSGQPDHKTFKTPKFYRGVGYTETNDFVMYKKELGKETYPIVLEINEDQKLGFDNSLLGEPGQIIGEIYTVKWQSIVELDQYHLNMVQFNRIRCSVVVPYTLQGSDRLEIKHVHVWMYIGNPEFWNPQLFSNEGKKLFSRSIRLFSSKDKENGEPLGAYYTFDYKIEAYT